MAVGIAVGLPVDMAAGMAVGVVVDTPVGVPISMAIGEAVRMARTPAAVGMTVGMAIGAVETKYVPSMVGVEVGIVGMSVRVSEDLAKLSASATNLTCLAYIAGLFRVVQIDRDCAA